MAVADVTNSTSVIPANTSSTNSVAANALMSNYDMFLKMLTTQLRVQNPLEPMDAEKFTQQLVQFSSVEQQIQTNQRLEDLLATMVSSATLNLVNYIGKTVEAASDVTQLKNGKASWTATSAAAAKDATVTIRNSAGAVVYEGKMDLARGDNSFDWDGKLANGSEAPEGAYQISIAAVDDTGAPVAVTSRIKGEVTGIDTSGSEPFLRIGSTMIPLSSLRSVSA